MRARRALFALVLLGATLLNGLVSACADIVFFVNAGPSAAANENLKSSLLNVAKRVDADSGVDRVAFLLNSDAERKNFHFDKLLSNVALNDAIGRVDSAHEQFAERELRHASAANSAPTLDEALEAVALRALKTRRATPGGGATLPLAILLFDADGAAAFATHSGRFAALLRRHAAAADDDDVRFFIVSPRADRIKISLQLHETEARLISTRAAEIDALLPLAKCASKLGRDVRRRPAAPTAAAAASTAHGIVPGTLILAGGQNQTQRQLQQRVLSNNNAPLSRQQKAATTKPTTTTRRATTTAQTTTQRAFTGRPGCQFDIVLLMDFSGGAADKRERYLSLATEFVRVLDVGEYGAQVALVRYSGPGRSDTVFHLKKHRSTVSVVNDIQNALPLGGTTRTAAALLYARHEFDEKYGGRGSKAERSLVLFTDGHSQDDPNDAAIQLKQNRIHVYTVAVEDVDQPPNLDQLRAIASDHASAMLEAQFGQLTRRFAGRRCR